MLVGNQLPILLISFRGLVFPWNSKVFWASNDSNSKPRTLLLAIFGVYKRKTGTLKALTLRPIGPNNRISGHEDWIKQGQSVHGAVDLGLEI